MQYLDGKEVKIIVLKVVLSDSYLGIKPSGFFPPSNIE